MLKLIRRIPLIIAFIAYFFWEIFLANLRVAFDILTVKHYMYPGIVAVPLEAKTPLEITLLANMISLTPGTLTIDVSNDRKVLYVHEMYLGGIENFKQFEARLLRVMR